MSRVDIKAEVAAALTDAQKLNKDIYEALVEAFYLEREAGRDPEDQGNYTEGNARQSRKQMKELATMILEVKDIL